MQTLKSVQSLQHSLSCQQDSSVHKSSTLILLAFGNGSEEDISKIVHRVIIWLIPFVLSDCPDVQDQDFLNDEARTKTRKFCRDSKPDPEEEESQRAESCPGCQERPGKEAGSQEVAADGQSQERRQGREGVASWQSSC